jgi:hypothetical protein
LAGAERVLSALPPERRGPWLAGVAQAVAQVNLDDAMVFVERYRGHPGYAEGLSAVLSGWAFVDPPRAARLLAEAAVQPTGETLLMIAAGWVQLDPAAAGAWAVAIPDEQLRNRAVRAVAMAWAQGGAEARDWLLELPRGPTRDAGLDVLLFATPQTGAASGALNSTLLEAYSSVRARQQGVGRAAVMIARRNADAARQLVETYVTDPQIRQQVEALLAQPDAQSRISAELFGMDMTR